MKKLIKKSKVSKNTFEAYACVCPTSCSCSTSAKKNSNYVELVSFNLNYIVLG